MTRIQTIASGSPVVTPTVIAVSTELYEPQRISMPSFRSYSAGVWTVPVGGARRNRSAAEGAGSGSSRSSGVR